MRKLIASLMAMALLTVGAQSAHALVVFDLTTANPLVGTLLASDTLGVTANVTATTNANPAIVTQQIQGLGVNALPNDTSPELGSINTSEILHFALSTPLTLTEIVLTNTSNQESITIKVDAGATGTVNVSTGTQAGFVWTLDVSSLSGLSGTVFNFGAGLDSDFYMTRLTFDDEPNEPTIPEPATLTLIGLGVSAVGFVRRRVRA